jgi:hypothetical protein
VLPTAVRTTTLAHQPSAASGTGSRRRRRQQNAAERAADSRHRGPRTLRGSTSPPMPGHARDYTPFSPGKGVWRPHRRPRRRPSAASRASLSPLQLSQSDVRLSGSSLPRRNLGVT